MAITESRTIYIYPARGNGKTTLMRELIKTYREAGYSLESLKQLFAKGYTLEPPNYDTTTMVELLEAMEREEGEN